MADDNGFGEYRRMLLDWHEADVVDRRETAEQLAIYRANHDAAHLRLDTSLQEIFSTLVEIKSERKIAKWIAGIMVPAIVALVATGAAHSFGW